MAEGGVIVFDVSQKYSKAVFEALKENNRGKVKVVLDDDNTEGEHYIYIKKLGDK